MHIGAVNPCSSLLTAAGGISSRKQGFEGIPSAARAAQDTLALSGAVPPALSPEERQRELEKILQQKQREQTQKHDALRKELEQSRQQAKAIGDAAKMQSKCFLIASRILAGDEVPREDHRFLAKNNPELYARSLTMRVAREEPRKYKRVSEDELPPSGVFPARGAAADPAALPKDGDNGTDATQGDSPAAKAEA